MFLVCLGVLFVFWSVLDEKVPSGPGKLLSQTHFGKKWKLFELFGIFHFYKKSLFGKVSFHYTVDFGGDLFDFSGS